MISEPDFDLEREVSLFLAACRTASLATSAADGTPHAANIQYASDGGFRLLWVSSPNTEHSQHTAQNPRAAITVYAHDDRPQSIHGVQMRGTVQPIENPTEWNNAWEAYTAKFPFVAIDPGFKVMIEKQSFYRFTPTWLRWIDNRRSFGWKVERDLN
ncbi:pyridoxamine 5'-phosphate oxidase family protein [Mucisphaera sp.]|uniref:pyridoxamine 5'-phosphate oxidase family protein n=1 Tax=Mucisphaera sp. TaxID=2913024 RepID=UPI003D1242D2